ncbi:MAG: hypothetical protein GY755_18335 [Chloroflexi bacterium]|nr:hypothetical protein [Chloroflexota bacterium]
MLQVLLDGLFVLKHNWTFLLGTVAIIISAGYALNFFFRPKFWQKNSYKHTTLIFFFAISLILRLAYLKNIFVPPYFDSATHFRIIKAMTEGSSPRIFSNAFSTGLENYYHLGFHTLASLLALGLRADLITVILLLGQLTLAMLPIPVFFLIWRETNSREAAFFSALLAGFGWYMPGFAVNWGKYPAISGLLAFEIALLLIVYLDSKKHYLAKGIQATSILLSIFIHSRTLILFSISFLGYFLSSKIATLEKEIQHKILRIELLNIFILGVLIYQEPLLKLAIEPYINENIWVTIIVFFLTPFALKKHSRAIHFSLFFILSLFISLFIPVNDVLPGLITHSLLDRPFVEMSLYIPLSILGGVGFSGLFQSLKKIKFLSERAYKPLSLLIASVLFFFTGLLISKSYNFYPSDCCNFVSYDDTIAFEWINNNLPENTSILVASNPLRVQPLTNSSDLVGSDAGIWIPQLTKKKITLAPYTLDFLSGETREFLCHSQTNYIYVGNKEQSFTSRALLQKREWYKKSLSLSNTQLFQLINCSEQ